jgi:ubiquinone/menaquinone biosynthesis C-methylase UbiE
MLIFFLLAACCFGQTDYASMLAAAKRSDPNREPHQRASDVLLAAQIKRGDSAADIGAGSGYYIARLSGMVGPTGRVFAVEVAETALGVLRERVRTDGLKNVAVVRGEPGDPHLDAASLDAVLIVDAYHDFVQHQGMLQQIHKALKRGGRLVIADYFSPQADNQPRENQARRHVLAPSLAVEELRRAGFTVEKLEDPFLDRKPEAKGSHIAEAALWLLAAIRPL